MTFDLAARVTASASNVIILPDPDILRRKIVVIGQYDETTKTDLVPLKLYEITSVTQAGNLFGFGFMLHRLIRALWKGTLGQVEVWALPQERVSGARGDDAFRVYATGVLEGTIHFYWGGEPVPVKVERGQDQDTITDNIIAAVNANRDLPVYAEDGAYTNQVSIKSKDIAGWGSAITQAYNLNYGEELPQGLSLTGFADALDMAGGYPDIDDALDILGLNDDQNQHGFTALVHGYQCPGSGGG